MRAYVLARLLLPLLAATLMGVAAWVVLLNFAWLILWGLVAFVPLFTAAGLWWRQRLVRDEATPPFGTGPVRRPGATPGLEGPRKVVPGVVVSGELARAGGEREG